MSYPIRTIHSSFASGLSPSSSTSSWASSSPYATTSSSARASNLLTGYLTRLPPGLVHSDWRGPSGGIGGAGGYNQYPKRRTSVSIRVPSPGRRSAPPPPPQVETPTFPRTELASVSSSSLKFDPFSDDFSIDEPAVAPTYGHHHYRSRTSSMGPVLYRTPRMGSTRPASSTQLSSSYVIQLEPAPLLPSTHDRDARSKLVAGILLNRVHAVGKPMRGGRCRTEPREYVKSGLSRVVSLEV